jgi:hypothetical protein
MNSANLIQAVRGPVMLTALGILFAIDHFGQFSFSRSWPMLVILFGVLKLGERVAARPEPAPVDVPPGRDPL